MAASLKAPILATLPRTSLPTDFIRDIAVTPLPHESYHVENDTIVNASLTKDGGNTFITAFLLLPHGQTGESDLCILTVSGMTARLRFTDGVAGALELSTVPAQLPLPIGVGVVAKAGGTHEGPGTELNLLVGESGVEVTYDPALFAAARIRALVEQLEALLLNSQSSLVPDSQQSFPDPNGKVGKPALPWPPVGAEDDQDEEPATETQQKMQSVWAECFPNFDSVPVATHFLDLGGHSILATQLLFRIRKAFHVDVPYKEVYEGSIKSCAAFIDSGGNSAQQRTPKESEYATDVRTLVNSLPASFPVVSYPGARQTVFLTGATGFVGRYILRDLLKNDAVGKVMCLVRGESVLDGYDDKRVKIVKGNLSDERLGMSEDDWARVEKEVVVIVHNGALVHWMHPYRKLRPANVLSVMQAISLCASSIKPKRLVFMSSTSVFDTPYYGRAENQPVDEKNALEGGREGLQNGYSQTKWVGEMLLEEAGRRGLEGCVVRCCYVAGDRDSGVSNIDDFIWRVVKASVGLGCAPLIEGPNGERMGINIVHVGGIARIVARVTCVPAGGMTTVNVTAGSLPSFNTIHSLLRPPLPMVPYAEWLERLEETMEGTALAPLLHLVRAGLLLHGRVRLSCTNLRAAFGADGEREIDDLSVTPAMIKAYLGWLADVGWLTHSGPGIAR